MKDCLRTNNGQLREIRTDTGPVQAKYSNHHVMLHLGYHSDLKDASSSQTFDSLRKPFPVIKRFLN